MLKIVMLNKLDYTGSTKSGTYYTY